MRIIYGKALVEHLRVYVVTDERADGWALLPIIRAALAGGATAIQLRRKAELGRAFVELGRAVRELTRAHDALFIVNDRVDVARIVDADGVHVGQDDISCQDARLLLGPDRLIGVSTETPDEARAAVQAGADYLGVGAVYKARSKDDAGYIGLDGLSAIAKSVSIPIVAIGGIDAERAPAALAHGAHGIAVVSAVMKADDPQEAARALAKLQSM